MSVYNGLLPLYKPRGMTSHDCVSQLRQLLHFKKIGHTGTLDPDVDGVLVLCLGRATKIAQYLLAYDKAYEGIIRLGLSTTTEDASGAPVARKSVDQQFSRENIMRAMLELTGEIDQAAPMYSAVKVNGKKLYEYARAGIAVEPPVRKVTVYQFQLNSDALSFSTDLPFKVVCSKGTYIRALAVAIGRKLGYPAHLYQMTRTLAGPFSMEDCLTFEQIEQLHREDQFVHALKPLEFGLTHMAQWVVDDEKAAKVANGAVLAAPDSFGAGPCAVLNKRNECLAIYRLHPNKPGLVKPDRVLAHDVSE